MNPPKMKGLGRGLDALLAANNGTEVSRQETLPVGENYVHLFRQM